MHAYLFIGSDGQKVDDEIIAHILQAQSRRIDFELSKVAQVRELLSLVKLTIDSPQTFVIKNIDKATDETQQAFLKTLEEPQKNLSFILTATSKHTLLPTILSRCQIKTVNGQRSTINGHAKEFLDMQVGEKLNFITTIKDRDGALRFIEELTRFLEKRLHLPRGAQKSVAHQLKLADTTRTNLLANGNVGLQLTNFVVQMSDFEDQESDKKQSRV